jgi:hypothetical protein
MISWPLEILDRNGDRCLVNIQADILLVDSERRSSSLVGDANNHNLPQSGRLFILREIAISTAQKLGVGTFSTSHSLSVRVFVSCIGHIKARPIAPCNTT